jgi:hypothetical protein
MALTGAPVMGHKCKMYVKISSTWTPVDIVNDTIETPVARDEASLKERGNLETLYDVGHFERSASGQVTTRFGNTVYDLLDDAFANGTVVEMAFTNGLIPTDADSRGNTGGYVLTEWARSEPVGGFTSNKFTAKPAIAGPAITRINEA